MMSAREKGTEGEDRPQVEVAVAVVGVCVGSSSSEDFGTLYGRNGGWTVEVSSTGTLVEEMVGILALGEGKPDCL